MKLTIATTIDEFMSEIANRIVRIRIARGWTQHDLAERSGVSKSSIERLESGNGNPKMRIFVAVCRTLGLADGFEVLLPEPIATPFDIFNGAKTPKRVRHAKTKVTRWGDER